MDETLFASSPTGRLVPTAHGPKAFLPDPLPPILDGSRLWLQLGEAMQALGSLNGLARRMPNPFMVIRPLQRREALTSSSMEGTHASPDELVLLESGDEQNVEQSTKEVLNYIRALENGARALQDLPISSRLICDAHRTLLSGLDRHRGAGKRPGEYKIHQNFIGGRTIEEARFIPPPPKEAEQAMDALERYINQELPPLPPLIDAALIHYQFETIHPFADGNGRVGRILIPIFLQARGVLDTPILYVSPYIEANKDRYIDLMFAVSRDGAWHEWVLFFLEAVRETCVETQETIDSLLSLQDKYRRTAQGLSRSTSILTIVDSLFEHPVLTIPRAAEIAGVTYAAAATAIGKLVDGGILRELTGTSGAKRFMAPEIVRISSGYFRRRVPDTSTPI